MDKNKVITKSLTEAIQLENERPSISALQTAGRKRGRGKATRGSKGKGKEKEVVQAESSISGNGNHQNPIFVVCDNGPEFQGLDSSSQVWYSCSEEDDSQEEHLPQHSQVGYQDEDQDYYLHYSSQDENELENGNDKLDSHLENQGSEVPMSTPIHQSSQIQHRSKGIQQESTPPISKPKSLSKTQADALPIAPKRRTPRTAAKRAALAISEMATVMPIPKRWRK